MDNNSDFAQQFTQNIKATATQPAYTTQPPVASNGAKLPLIVAAILAVVVLVESIALIITLNNYFSFFGENNSYGEEAATTEDGYTDGNFIYDANDNLTAMNLTCTTEDGRSYGFSIDGKYQQLSGPDILSSFGTYTITNDTLIALNNSANNGKVLYYDGLNLADGLTIYECK